MASAVQCPLTATPRRQSEVSKLEFGRNWGKFLRHFKGFF
jgi:hypothetical protein